MEKVVILLILTKTTFQACNAGTLRCNKTDQSLICDVQDFYKINAANQQCEKSTLENCQFLFQNGNCKSCKSGFFWSNNDCTEVTKVIENCSEYASLQSCKHCNIGYYLKSGNCIPVETLVPNCIQYDSSGVCSVCDFNSYLSPETKLCSEIQTIPNCYKYSEFKCNSCDSGYFLNRNFFWTQIPNYESEEDLFKLVFDVDSSKQGKGMKEIAPNVCQIVTAQNCSILESFDKCNICNSGYYLTTSYQCKKFPLDRIENCQEYSSETNCSKCVQGQYLKNSSKCEKNQATIEGCLEYNTSASTSQCSYCQDEYYKSGNGCSLRDTFIERCSLQNPNSDNSCSQCISGQALTENMQFCGELISNCVKYEKDQNSDKKLVCLQCDQKFFINIQNGQCQLGSIENCLVYQINAEKCFECSPNYYLYEGLCYRHSEILNCTQYHPLQQNFCQKCQNHFFPVKYNKICVIHDIINNCQSQTSTMLSTDCSVCKEGYRRDISGSGTTCEEISIENCLIESGSNCTKCEIGLGIDSLNGELGSQCLSPLDYIKHQCAENSFSLNQTDFFYKTTCFNCKQGANFYDLNENNVCMRESNRSQLKNPLSIIIGCITYQWDNVNSVYKCIKCKEKYIKTEGISSSCVEPIDCYDETNIGSKAIKPFVLSQNQITLHESCSNDDTSQEKAVIVNAMENNTYIEGVEITIKCQTNWANVVDYTSLLYSQVNPDGTFDNWISNIYDVYPALICNTPTVTDKINGSEILEKGKVPPELNFEYFKYDQVNFDYIAMKCLHGKTADSDNMDTKGFINCNVDIINCNTDFKLKNLHVYWASLLSCHQCQINQIPVFSYNSSDVNSYIITGFKSYDLENDDYIYQTSPGTPQTFCMSTESSMASQIESKFALNDQSLIGTVDFCAFYAFNQNYTNKTFNSTSANQSTLIDGKIALLCGSCLPGYSPSFITNTDQKFVYSCTLIENCSLDNATATNVCEVCDNGFYHVKDSNHTICSQILHENVPVIFSNCIEIDDTECTLCSEGYIKNSDKICEKITNYSNCLENQYDIQLFSNDSKFFMPLILKGRGCYECAEDFFGLKLTEDLNMPTYVCLGNDFMKSVFTPIFDGNATTYFNNCLNYKIVENVQLCGKCEDNFLINQLGTECIDKSTRPNCLELDNDGNCQTCENTHGLLNDKTCSQGEVTNCQIYNSDIAEATVKCLNCNNNYSLTILNNSCVLGNVENCKIYPNNSVNECSQCFDDFYLIPKAKMFNKEFSDSSVILERDYCFPKDQQLNCGQGGLEVSQVLNHLRLSDGYIQLSCNDCPENGYLKTISDPYKTDQIGVDVISGCLSVSLVENCENYLIGENSFLAESNFSCIKCSSGYYRKTEDKGNKCTKREKEILNCKILSDTKEECQECEEYYFLNSDKECEEFPIGIPKCSIYQDSKTCLACSGDFYLLDSQTCAAVSIPIKDCLQYKSNNECVECSIGKYLESIPEIDNDHKNQCIEGIENCIEYGTKNTECIKCVDGNRIIENNGTSVCESFSPEFCLTYSQTGDNKCQKCENGSFLKLDGNCEKVSLEGCLIPKNSEECEVCQSSFALYDDGTCVSNSNIEEHCSSQSKPSSLVCSSCTGGYHFQNGSCVVNSLEGCYAYNESNPEQCLLCLDGYYMNSALICIQMNVEAVEQPVEKNKTVIFSIVWLVVYPILFQQI